MIMKVKEPLESEYKYFKRFNTLRLFHLAAEERLTKALLMLDNSYSI